MRRPAAAFAGRCASGQADRRFGWRSATARPVVGARARPSRRSCCSAATRCGSRAGRPRRSPPRRRCGAMPVARAARRSFTATSSRRARPWPRGVRSRANSGQAWSLTRPGPPVSGASASSWAITATPSRVARTSVSMRNPSAGASAKAARVLPSCRSVPPRWANRSGRGPCRNAKQAEWSGMGGHTRLHGSRRRGRVGRRRTEPSITSAPASTPTDGRGRPLRR